MVCLMRNNSTNFYFSWINIIVCTYDLIGVSGALAAEGNTFKGVLLKYSEPPESRKTSKKYRLYVFKGKEEIGKR